MYTSIDELVTEAGDTEPLTLAVAAAGDRVVLESVKRAQELGIINPVLIGNENKIKQLLSRMEYNFKGQIVNTESDRESAHRAVQLIAGGEADYPMKGFLDTRLILQALLTKEYGLREKGLLSLVTLIYLEKMDKLVILTDGGMNIAPSLEDKVKITENAVAIARAIGIEKPRVAPLAALEKVDSSMPVTVEAAALAKMGDRGQFGVASVDGPLAFDNAISRDAARHKEIDSPVAGRADILLVPDIEAGNILYKALIVYAGLPAASVVYGARLPLVLTSRADSRETKLNSIALGKIVTLGLK